MARDMVIRISEGVRRQFTQERFIAAEYDRGLFPDKYDLIFLFRINSRMAVGSISSHIY